MAEARIESAGKQDNVKVQHLEAKIEQLVADNKKKQMWAFYPAFPKSIWTYFFRLDLYSKIEIVFRRINSGSCFTDSSEFDETMDALQKELKDCERENAELKQIAKNFSRKTLLDVSKVSCKSCFHLLFFIFIVPI